MSNAKFELLDSDLDPNGHVHCPNLLADLRLWSGHPKVSLDVSRTGQVRCPYCGTVYKLKAARRSSAKH
ncbi:zinc-finger domain-containing protein [Candidatus Symbiobacter mobilis]|uniref:Zinc finger CHCC-type domain-containing protein n=1 Tax=Candidatus Symbiobacter mobilis CR TaxID=946483 RepID=U5N835_9BURK|nr:zinc-finger domain-containing protein [Candidatus Symbiobacter mobilis]AGX87562.1 hypothetical protein Cenrod_1476 [Candidatus Symbiobacter mobilis CR]